MSAVERCPPFLSAIKRFHYETLTMISIVLRKSVRHREVFAFSVRYKEVPLWYDRFYKTEVRSQGGGYSMIRYVTQGVTEMLRFVI